MKRFHAYLHTEKINNREYYCVVVVNAEGVEVDCFDAEVNRGSEIKALIATLMQHGSRPITFYTTSDKFYHILVDEKYKRYTGSDWSVLQIYAKHHKLEVKKLLRENAFIEKAKKILYEKNSSARGWTIRTEA